jgi:hypothetical protein
MICCQDFMARGAAINPTGGCDRATTGAAQGRRRRCASQCSRHRSKWHSSTSTSSVARTCQIEIDAASPTSHVEAGGRDALIEKDQPAARRAAPYRTAAIPRAQGISKRTPSQAQAGHKGNRCWRALITGRRSNAATQLMASEFELVTGHWPAVTSAPRSP